MQLYGLNVLTDAGSVTSAQSKSTATNASESTTPRSESLAAPRNSLFERMMRKAREAQADPSGSAVFTDQVMQSERSMSSGSKAWQRQENISSGRENASQQQANYRDALQDAASQRQDSAAKQGDSQQPKTPTANPDSTTKAETPKLTSSQESETASKGFQRPTAGEGKAVSNENIRMGERQTIEGRLTSADTKPAIKPTVNVQAVRNLSLPQNAAAMRSAAPAGRTAEGVQATSNVKGADAISASENKRSFDSALKTAKTQTEAKQEASESKNSANADRLLRTLRMQIKEDKSTAIMRLDPPEMGKIKIQIDFQQQSLSLRFGTSNELAQQLLESELDSLRQGLESAGISLERVEVLSPDDSAGMQDADDSQLADHQTDYHDGSADVDAEHSRQGKEAQDAVPEEAMHEASMEDADTPVLVAESLVNVMA